MKVVKLARGTGVEPACDVQGGQIDRLVARNCQPLPEVIERRVIETLLPVRHWPSQGDVHRPRMTMVVDLLPVDESLRLIGTAGNAIDQSGQPAPARDCPADRRRPRAGPRRAS